MDRAIGNARVQVPSDCVNALAVGATGNVGLTWKQALPPLLGTSFASPYLLRNAVGVRAMLGADLTPLAMKALLVHGADCAEHDKIKVGWGKVPEDLMDIITCPPGVARVVYQGELKPGKYLRAALPLPAYDLQGNIRLIATFCYASPTDPQDAVSYTRAGLEVVFRPSEQYIAWLDTRAL